KLLHRGRKGIAGRDVQAHVADDYAEDGILGLVLQRLEALHERQSGVEQRRKLLREDGELPQRQLVGLCLPFERLLLCRSLCRTKIRTLRRRRGGASVPGRTRRGGSDERHGSNQASRLLTGNAIYPLGR